MRLSPEEQEEIQKAIGNKTPADFGLEGCLWTLGWARQYIKQRFRREISTWSVSDYMQRWDMTCQRPVRCAEEKDAAIYWGDETGVNNCENVERGFSRKGHPPVLPVETKRIRVNMISAISNQGWVRFMLYRDSMNQQRLIEFMRRLVRTSRQKVFLLPPYTPEFNPDEYLNHLCAYFSTISVVFQPFSVTLAVPGFIR